MEMTGAPGQDDDGAWRVSLELLFLELIAQADVENAGYDGIDTVLVMPVRHELHAGRNLDADHVRAGLLGMTHNDGEASRRRKRRERLPVDILGQHRPEDSLIWLVHAHPGDRSAAAAPAAPVRSLAPAPAHPRAGQVSCPGFPATA